METLMEQPTLDEKSAYHTFFTDYPTYADTHLLDEWRQQEYGRLDQNQQIYLDYTGGGLYAQSQLNQHFNLLQHHVYGNPHSINPTSQAITDLVEETRTAVMQHFNASPDEYIAIFTPNASGALKLIGEAYPFTPDSHYLLAYDNHNSVNGIREFARAQGAKFTYAPLTIPDLRMDDEAVTQLLETAVPTHNNLFAYPAQSNFSGVKHSLDWVSKAQALGWDVLLDIAAFAPTNPLDLNTVKPDFVTLSFYKMFGYPTGVGALLMRKLMIQKLQRPWFAGGTVNFATAQGETHLLAANEARFEDGTINYLSIPAVKFGLDHLHNVGLDSIGERVRCLTDWLIQQLLELRHSNGLPMVRLYGPANTHQHGGTITLNFYDPDEHLLDYRHIEELAANENISLRTGCFCNPGAGEIAEGLTREDMLAGLQLGASLDLPHFLQIIQHRDHKSAGAIRISFGIASNFADVYRFYQFATTFRDQTNLSIGEVTFHIESCRQIRSGS